MIDKETRDGLLNIYRHLEKWKSALVDVYVDVHNALDRKATEERDPYEISCVNDIGYALACLNEGLPT